MNHADARQFLNEQVKPVFKLLTIRNGASLTQALEKISAFEIAVNSLPMDISWPEDVEYSLVYNNLRLQIAESWPELGFYALKSGNSHWESGLVGDAVDDFTDIALDLCRVLEMSEKYPIEALSLLRFCFDSHFGEHIQDVNRHLRWKISE